MGRISQTHNSTAEYFLGDALGSVRQLTDQSGQVTYAESYDPYGVVINTNGASQSAYGYTGEQQDASGLVYLRSRYYNAADGRFTSRDTWTGSVNRPLSMNRWGYVEGNPVNNSDPSGLCRQFNWNDPSGELFSEENCDMLENIYLEPSSENLPKMVEWYEKLADAAEKDANVQSAANLRHFLHGNGASLRLSDEFMRNQIWNWKHIQDKVNKLVEWNTQLNCQLDLDSNGGYFTPVVVFPGGLLGTLTTLLLDPPSDIAGSLGNFRLDAVISGNIQKAKGFFSTNISADVNVHLVVLDYYDWEEGNNATVQVNGKYHGIPDDWGYTLASYGYGHNFFVRGDLDVNQKVMTKASWFEVGETPPNGWYPASCIGAESNPPPL